MSAMLVIFMLEQEQPLLRELPQQINALCSARHAPFQSFFQGLRPS